MASSVDAMDEAAELSAGTRRGGWITFPFIIGTMACLTLASGGWVANLIVYLIQEFNFKSISAAKVYNFVNGSITMLPIVGAVIADSFTGCFSVICFSSLVSLLGMLVLVLTAAIDQLRPKTCKNGSNPCDYPSQLQLAVLYLGLALASLGNAGTRFTIAPMGAHQFKSPGQQGIFFNWYIFTMYTATVISSTAIVYVEDNVSWVWGFGLCAAANLLGLVVFLIGKRFYRPFKARGSPFRGLARVLVGAISKRRMPLSDNSKDYYCCHEDPKTPTNFFRFLNRAALRSETKDSMQVQDKSCTVKEVENLKALIKIFPLWSTGLFLCTPLAIQLSLSVIQALSMDRRLGGSHFRIPAGSMPVFILISTSLSILIIDRAKITKTPLTLLQRIGIGHALTVVSMAISALVESKRLKAGGPISAMWLVPQLAVAGLGEAFHFPGQVSLYYREFPEELKSTSTAAVAMFIGIAFYISNAIIDLLRKLTGWLPDDINEGRLDNVYWVCCAVGGFNFGCYIACALLYKYQNVQESEDGCGES
ncbi:Protein NRT1/ PTR FAMILY 2.7 [Striga hermonthica]|uniref:Protein NRT1/ PTR FAMILY 2.7 n=1 Tax=Striga hermonthica TaxID=68872 RepID=A0A9N7MQL8_STRHE|nr:Protein NRT1/ PTR FAMILY 2.7 [Striga hermonthica]